MVFDHRAIRPLEYRPTAGRLQSEATFVHQSVVGPTQE
jgi:hypothetical protein